MNKGDEVLNPINVGLEISDPFGLDPQELNWNCDCNCQCQCDPPAPDRNCACNDIDCSTRMVNR